MRTTTRTVGRTALALLLAGLVTLAGTGATTRRDRVHRARHDVELLRRGIGAQPHERADDVVARTEARVDSLRARHEHPVETADEATRRIAERLAEAAARRGVTLEQLVEQPRASVVSANTEGTPAAVLGLAGEVDRLVHGGAARVRELSLLALPGNVVRVSLSMRALPGGAGRTARITASRHTGIGRHTTAVWAWPAHTDEAGEPSRSEAPASRQSAPEPGRPTPPAYLGTVSSPGRVRYAVRVEPHGTVALVGRGDTAFGWTLAEAEPRRLVFEREGVRYEMDR
ncbi:MAG: hypothetical protein ACOCVW_00570 [bacterium]